MTSFSLEATLYLIHHIVLPPKLPQADDCEVEYENALLDITIESLQKFGEAIQKVEPEVARYVCRYLSLGVIFIEGIQEHYLRPPFVSSLWSL